VRASTVNLGPTGGTEPEEAGVRASTVNLGPSGGTLRFISSHTRRVVSFSAEFLSQFPDTRGGRCVRGRAQAARDAVPRG
jgi:hypothetical protein